MLTVLSVCEEVQNQLDISFTRVQNIDLVCHGSQRNKQHIPEVLVCCYGVLAFVQVEDCSEESESNRVLWFRNILNTLAEKLDVSVNSFLLYGYTLAENDTNVISTLCSFNNYNDRISYFVCDEMVGDFINSISNEFSYRRAIFDEKQISELSFNLELITGSNGKIKRDSEGNFYIKKHGRWFQASELDPDEIFRKTALFGAFGAHQFSERKLTAGFVYLLTCGLFGVGWLFDCLAILFGFYTDKEGKYLLPVTNFKDSCLKMFVGLFITVSYIFVYYFTFCFLGTLLNNTTGSLVASKEGLPQNTPQ